MQFGILTWVFNILFFDVLFMAKIYAFSSFYISICSLLHGSFAYMSVCGIVLVLLYVFINLCFLVFCFLVFLAEDEKLLELDLDDVLQQTYDLKDNISAVDKELAHAEKLVHLVKMRKEYAELISTKCKYDDSVQRLSNMKWFLFDNGAYSFMFHFCYLLF